MTYKPEDNLSLPNCSFSWDSYVIVRKVDKCEVNQMDETAYFEFSQHYVTMSLSILGAFFNLWALILLILDYQYPTAAKKYLNSFQSSGSNVAASKVINTSSRRTTMHLGLIVFCLFEVLYHTASSSSQSVFIFVHSIIEKGKFPKLEDEGEGSLTYIYSVLPPMTSFFDWIRDTGICGRNWAITLITMARAEVVIWPLASRCYQRFLRQKRFFILFFGLFAFTGLIISGLRRFDQQIKVCYNNRLQSYCVTSEEFLFLDNRKVSAAYFSFQSFLPWMLILIHTTLMIFQLKPCTKPAENSILRPRSKTCGRDSKVRASIAVTVIAVFFTIFEFPTFALSMYYVASDTPESFPTCDTIANTLLQIDSITNFFLLIITMPSLRHRLRKICPSRKLQDSASFPELQTMEEEVNVSLRDRV